MTFWKNFGLIACVLCLKICASQTEWEEKLPNGFSAKATVKPNTAIISDFISIELALQYPAEYRVDTRGLLSSLLRNPAPTPAPFKLQSIHEQPIDTTQGLKSEILQYTLEAMALGRHALTFLAIKFLPESDHDLPAVSLMSGILEVEIIAPPESPILENLQAAALDLEKRLPIDIDMDLRNRIDELWLSQAPSLNVKRFNSKKFPWEPVALILGLGLLGVFHHFRNRNVTQELPVKLSNEFLMEANSKLEKLQQESQVNPELARSYFDDLASAVRLNSEESYGIKAASATTEEFIAALPQVSGFPKDKSDEIINFLNYADKVKFAKVKPTIEDCLAAQATAISFLN